MLGNRFTRRRGSSENFGSDNVNPMDGVANLADVMLVLSVGIMLALIIAYEVPVGSTDDSASANDTTQIDEISEPNKVEVSDESGMDLSDLGLQSYGQAYIDENGEYYIVEDGQ